MWKLKPDGCFTVEGVALAKDGWNDRASLCARLVPSTSHIIPDAAVIPPTGIFDAGSLDQSDEERQT